MSTTEIKNSSCKNMMAQSKPLSCTAVYKALALAGWASNDSATDWNYSDGGEDGGGTHNDSASQTVTTLMGREEKDGGQG